MSSDDYDPLTIKQPNRYVLRMLGFLGLTALIVWLIWNPLTEAVRANVFLNGGILLVLLLGIIYTFGQVLNLRPEIKWLNKYRSSETTNIKPRLLTPMARLLGDTGTALGISPVLMRSILDSIDARLNETREIARYMVGLLIFLGLLGTFWGLLKTVSSVGETIQSLSVGVGPVEDTFEDLRLGLEAPLSGMGTAFSSSLVGLAGSLILGFLDLQMGQAQTHFYNDVEEWLSQNTASLPQSMDLDTGGPETSADIDTAKMMEMMQYTMSSLRTLSAQLTDLSSHMKNQQSMMEQLSQAQAGLVPIVEKVAQAGGAASREGGVTMEQYAEAMYGHLHNIDSALQNLSQDAVQGRDMAVHELKQEISRLTQTIIDISSE